VIEMARIINAHISQPSREGDIWLFLIEYDVTFTPSEANVSFDDAVALWERDPTDDDLIVPYQIVNRFAAPDRGQDGNVPALHRVQGIKSGCVG
jgi:hypothetical protein